MAQLLIHKETDMYLNTVFLDTVYELKHITQYASNH